MIKTKDMIADIAVGVYTREEMSKMLKVSLDDRNFARLVKNKLDRLGYVYRYNRSFVNILHRKTEPKVLIDALAYNLFGSKKYLQNDGFLIFMFRMCGDYVFQGAPIKEKIRILKDKDGIPVAKRTVEKWMEYLKNDLSLVSKTGQKAIWKTYRNEFGLKNQVRLSLNNVNEYVKYERVIEKNGLGVSKDIWDENGFIYYQCSIYGYYISFDEPEDIFIELLSMIRDYYKISFYKKSDVVAYDKKVCQKLKSIKRKIEDEEKVEKFIF